MNSFLDLYVNVSASMWFFTVLIESLYVGTPMIIVLLLLNSILAMCNLFQTVRGAMLLFFRGLRVVKRLSDVIINYLTT